MGRRAWLASLLLGACAPPPAPPAPVPPRPAPVAAPLPPAPAPRLRSRRGECELDPAIDAFLMGQDAVRCGDLKRRPKRDDSERARACMLAALRDHRAFAVLWGGPNIDSIIRGAFVGRDLGDGYETREFTYDSCPSGCGADDPVWGSVRCEPLVDVRAVCATLARNPKARVDAEASWFCQDDVMPNSNPLDFICHGRTQPHGCYRESE